MECRWTRQAEAVLPNIDAVEKVEEKRQLLRRLAQGEAEIAADRGHNLDDVLADSDSLLKACRA